MATALPWSSRATTAPYSATVHPDALLTLHTKLAVYDPSGPLSTEVFTISRDQVAPLKHLFGGTSTSTFCPVSALI
jgi:shikimate O-hydroxycinnamoyltransferase